MQIKKERDFVAGSILQMETTTIVELCYSHYWIVLLLKVEN